MVVEVEQAQMLRVSTVVVHSMGALVVRVVEEMPIPIMVVRVVQLLAILRVEEGLREQPQVALVALVTMVPMSIVEMEEVAEEVQEREILVE